MLLSIPVHPNDSPSDSLVIPMTENRLLEASFADAIAAIEKAEELSPSKRTHWACSLRRVAKALDRPLESIAARWGAVALQINQLHHANSSVEWKTLANHKSNAKVALFWFRNEQGLPPRGTPLRPEWKALRGRLKDLSRLGKLSGLIRYCSLKGIASHQVDEAVVDAYMAYRKETTALAVDNKARRAIARAWNASRAIKDWPQQQLIEPPLKAKEGPGWEDFPQRLQDDVASHLKVLATHRRGKGGKHLRPCKASTLRTRRTDLISFAKKVVRLGTPIDSLTSLSVLLDPEIVDRVIDKEWQENGSEPKTSTVDLGKKLVAVARSAGCLTPEQLGQLDDKRATLEQYRREGLTPKNLKLIRQVLNSEVWARVVNCPDDLMRRARSLKDQAPVKAAITAQIAVAVAVLTFAPIRAANLASIRLGENLVKPGGPDSPYLLVFPDYDVKNRVDLAFPLDDFVTAVIDEYVHDYRPALMRGSHKDRLFPGEAGGCKDAHLLGIQVTERIQKVTGLRITLHQYRHAAAAIYLKHHPGDYETVRRFLGHRNVRTTVNFYCGLETTQATRLLGDVVRQHRRGKSDTARNGENP
jgi:integrase